MPKAESIFVSFFDILSVFNPDVWTAAATVLLTFITGGLVIVGYWQIRTIRAQLRAYVFVSAAKVTNVVEGNDIPQVHVYIKNYGQTPAYELRNPHRGIPTPQKSRDRRARK
jgi:hypothetical protein